MTFSGRTRGWRACRDRAGRFRLALLPRGSGAHRRSVEHRSRSERDGQGDPARDHQQCPDPAPQGRGNYKRHPEIDDEVIGGPVFVIGLPRTGTTALSQLVANDPQFRSLRLWESQACTPPPEAATQHTDSRIAQAAEGIAMMDSMFPRMRSMMSSEPEAATECQDLMGNGSPHFPFRRRGPCAQLPGVADALRYARDLHLPPSGAQISSVALPADAVASAYAGAHVRP